MERLQLSVSGVEVKLDGRGPCGHRPINSIHTTPHLQAKGQSHLRVKSESEETGVGNSESHGPVDDTHDIVVLQEASRERSVERCDGGRGGERGEGRGVMVEGWEEWRGVMVGEWGSGEV